MGDAARSDLSCRRDGAAGPALDGGRARDAAISVPGYRPGAELAGVHGGDCAPAGTGIELRICRCGWQYRLPRGRRITTAAQLSRRRSGGWHAAGALPRRRNYRGDVPVDGTSGNFEWDGYIPFDELPSVYNPPGGLIVSANQNTFPETFPYPVNGNLAPPYGAQQIRARLAARNGWRAQDLLAVQKDIYSAFSHFLAGQLVGAYEKRNAHNPALEPAVGLLRAWNGQMDKDMAAPFQIGRAHV